MTRDEILLKIIKLAYQEANDEVDGIFENQFVKIEVNIDQKLSFSDLLIQFIGFPKDNSHKYIDPTNGEIEKEMNRTSKEDGYLLCHDMLSGYFYDEMEDDSDESCRKCLAWFELTFKEFKEENPNFIVGSIQ